ncbi:MAG: hypothetical protein KME06_02745 [Kastovskya adunca ATA6-11-RM4]|jgi:hypothetical protein|nr:hypothetical protein [Kastovskya adunca ATA6-11-RM4]
MSGIISILRGIRLHKIFAVLLAVSAFLVVPAFSASPSLYARADQSAYTGGDRYAGSDYVDKGTIKRVQQRAEDLGDSEERPIGDTGLKNLKKLGENIPETIGLNARQGFFGGDPDNLDKDNVVDNAKRAVEGTKRAVQDAVD